MGSSNASLIMTLVNSIIGVSILAMPFCYKQCGILLASLILIFSNLMTRLSCHYLLKSAMMTRRRTFELLAFHALGPAGKTLVEISIILLMIGTCIAFFVVMGDLSPPIIGSLLELKMTAALRPAVLLGTLILYDVATGEGIAFISFLRSNGGSPNSSIALFVVLPLGLLRNVDSLSSICTASFLFYLFLVFKVFTECTNNLFSGSWMDEVHFWRPAGILQCLPIFSMALSCQTQLLEVFDSAPNGTLDRMNSIVKSAVNLCTALYISVGFFGYIGFYKQPFSGNLLMSFADTYFSEFIKLGFVLSVAVTFPLVIFPCRASLHSLLFKKAHAPHYELVTGGGNHIPEAHFKCITFFIITVSLIVGLLAPNIEIVLGLLGSTIGVIICFLCPPILFVCISSKATTEKVLAQFLCAFGLFIMIMGTYANLYLSEAGNDVELQKWKSVDQDIIKVPEAAQLKEIPPKINLPIEVKDTLAADAPKKPPPPDKVPESIDVAKKAEPPADLPKDDKRMEPPIPEAPPKSKEAAEQQAADVESKRVEPPVPVAPLADSNKEAAPKEVSKDENKPAQVDSAAAVKPVAAESPPSKPLVSSSLPKDSGKPHAGAALKTEKKEPLPPAGQKSLSNGEKLLLNEQKEIIQKMRGAKNQNAKIPAVKAMEKKLDRKKEPSLEKRAPPAVVAEVKKAEASPVLQNEAQREQKKIPLPLLVHSNGKAEDGSHAGEPPKREILENVAPDREKRDLYYVTEGYRENQPMVADSKANANMETASELKPAHVELHKDISDAKPGATELKPAPEEARKDTSAAKQGAAESKSVHAEPHKDTIVEKPGAVESKPAPVEPHEDVSVAKPKDYAADENLTCEKDSKSEATGPDTKVVSQELSPDRDSKPAESVAKREAEPQGTKEQEDSNTDDEFPAELSSRSNERKETASSDSKSDGLVIAPSKLSDPVVRLPESVSIDDKLKPALHNVMKPMSRELKTVEDKPETSKKK